MMKPVMRPQRSSILSPPSLSYLSVFPYQLTEADPLLSLFDLIDDPVGGRKTADLKASQIGLPSSNR